VLARLVLLVSARAARNHLTITTERPRVHEPEAGCGQCDEHSWMRLNALRHALAACKPCASELVGVVLVQQRAWLASRRTPILTPHVQHAVGQVFGRPRPRDLARLGVDMTTPTGNPHWTLAAAHCTGLALHRYRLCTAFGNGLARFEDSCRHDYSDT
jgi:hypothetical protein